MNIKCLLIQRPKKDTTSLLCYFTMLLHCKIPESNHNETPEKLRFKNSTECLLVLFKNIKIMKDKGRRIVSIKGD